MNTVATATLTAARMVTRLSLGHGLSWATAVSPRCRSFLGTTPQWPRRGTMAVRAMASPPQRIPAGATREGDGIVVGEGAVAVDAYIDFLCPFCRMFEQESGAALEQMIESGIISLVYHPLGLLDRL